jgi:hypothetical protein
MERPMRGLMQLPFAELLGSIDFPLVFGGHSGYGTAPSREPSGGDDDGGIGAGTIIAVLALTAVTLGMLYQFSSASTKAKLKRFAPVAVLVLVIATPLALWAAFSGGDDKSLVVERSTSDKGKPELIVSLVETELNTLDTTNGRPAVRLECLSSDGRVVLNARQKWPFRNKERGYDYPHTHQTASLEQRQRADRCRLRGTRVPLETDVEGALTG